MTFRSLWPKDKLAAGMVLMSLLIGGDNLARMHESGGLWFRLFLVPAWLLAAGVWLYRAYRPKQPDL
jgi:hypothetical protein